MKFTRDPVEAKKARAAVNAAKSKLWSTMMLLTPDEYTEIEKRLNSLLMQDTDVMAPVHDLIKKMEEKS